MNKKQSGRVIIISGPSGAGKSTVVNRLLTECELPLVLSVSATTRPPRPGEIIGDRVEDCPEDCGTQIECPQPKAQELLDAYNSGEEAPVKNTPVKPSPEGL